MLKALGFALALLGSAASAAPRVAADIAPVHALVARVMKGVGAPGLIVPPGTSPHHYAMEPSTARALAGADLMDWVGEGLTPWLGPKLDALAGGAAKVELLEVPGAGLLPARRAATFEAHAHGENGDGTGREGHDHGAMDPHAWLDPVNAKVWLGAIAEALTEADPENAARYAANADAARREIDALAAEIEARVAPLRGRPFVVFHDAYRYFEHRFGLEAAGAVSISDASAPSAGRLSEVRGMLARLGPACVFVEPQFDTHIVEAVTEGTEARTATLDPVGIGIEPGPGFYATLMRRLGEDLASCLEDAAR